MKALRFPAALFFCYHALAIVAANFPRDNALAPALVAPFQAYLDATAQFQTWDMFDSIPNDRRMEVAAFLVRPDKTERRVGPVVPGFGDLAGDLRLTTFFYRLYPGEENESYWNRYAERFCRAARSAAEAPLDLYLDFVAYRTRGLDAIRRDGIVAEKDVTTRGPFHCGQGT